LNRRAPFVFHFAVEAVERPLTSAAARERQLAARNFYPNGDEILGPVQLEETHLQGDGGAGNRAAQEQRVLELALLVGGSKFAELLSGIVSGAEFDFCGEVFD